MFILPPVMLLILVLAIALPWRVIRRRRGSIPLLLVLAAALGPLLWWSWTRDMTYSVSTYINGELGGSYEEGYSSWYRVFVAGELALILAAGGILLGHRLRVRDRHPGRDAEPRASGSTGSLSPREGPTRSS